MLQSVVGQMAQTQTVQVFLRNVIPRTSLGSGIPPQVLLDLYFSPSPTEGMFHQMQTHSSRGPVLAYYPLHHKHPVQQITLSSFWRLTGNGQKMSTLLDIMCNLVEEDCITRICKDLHCILFTKWHIKEVNIPAF